MSLTKYFKPSNYRKKFLERKFNKSYDEYKVKNEELQKFKKANLDFEGATALLERVAKENSFEDFLNKQGMSNSIHWLLFACLALKGEVKSILEIGTYDGVTANFLSKLFPDAIIDTFDLPEDDPILAGSYKRENEAIRKEFLEKQATNTGSENVNLILKNSFFLPDSISSKQYDLVWIDGGHKYPDVAWDICNGFHAAKRGGWVMADDIMARLDAYETPNVNADSLEIFKYLEERVSADIFYFLKRTDARFSANPYKRKFVAFFQKP